MDSEQKFYQDESYFEKPRAEPLNADAQVQYLLDGYLKLSFEQQLNFNRILRQQKLHLL